MELKTKVAVVTGAGGGSGRAVARRLAREGACVIAFDKVSARRPADSGRLVREWPGH